MSTHPESTAHAASANASSPAAGAGVTRQLARHAATLRYEDLPAALVAMTKQCVLDTLGVSIGASGLAEEGAIVADFVKDQAGKAESTILGFGWKAPACWAAFVNGSFGHMLDYDDLGDGSHPSIATIPVAFALAEKLGGVSGRDLITAIACGTDLHTRVAQAIDIPDWTITEGWFGTQLLGYISGAATAGRLLGLDAERIETAWGISYTQMGGSRQMAVGAATHLRSMQAGFSGHASILAAELARRGISGSKEIIEGRYGFFHNYVRSKTPDWPALVGGLGSRFPLLDVHGFKVWPACAYTRPTNAAALRLRQEHDLRPEDIEAVTIVGGTGGTRLLSEPIELKRRPKSSIDGKYSIPFTTAVMFAKGNVTLRDYTDEGLRDPAVLAMADRVTYRKGYEGEPLKGGKGGASAGSIGRTAVEVRTRDGRVLVCKPDAVPGDAKNPVDQKLLEAKFRDCVSFSPKPVSAKNIDRAIEMIADLENLPDATEILRTLG
ncbi:MAG: MmgE/PrpD family protein [Betaproteobacteria bacterium]|nr:MmgE/PrpD family protein [Betaproteobacteria bacterium]